jgi:hypothetical protein
LVLVGVGVDLPQQAAMEPPEVVVLMELLHLFPDFLVLVGEGGKVLPRDRFLIMFMAVQVEELVVVLY